MSTNATRVGLADDEVLMREGGDQDHRAAQPLREVEATLVTETDVDQHDIRPKLLLESQRFGARRLSSTMRQRICILIVSAPHAPLCRAAVIPVHGLRKKI
jgi:hypothetical protein